MLFYFLCLLVISVSRLIKTCSAASISLMLFSIFVAIFLSLPFTDVAVQLAMREDVLHYLSDLTKL